MQISLVGSRSCVKEVIINKIVMFYNKKSYT